MSSDGHMVDFDRFGRITASVVPAITRTDPYHSRKWAWRVITGREPIRQPGPDARRGLEHEEDAITVVESQLAVLALPGRFVPHRDIDWLGASPDAFIREFYEDIELTIPVEGKCPRNLHIDIPPWYYDQVQTQLECCNCPYGYFVSWTENQQYVKKVVRSEPWWRETYPVLKQFYDEFVAPDIEPPTSPRRGSKGGAKNNEDQKKEQLESAAARVDDPPPVVKRGRGRPRKVKEV